MTATNAASLDYKIAEQASELTEAQKRETLDFMQFLATRRAARTKSKAAQHASKPQQSLEVIFDIAPGGAGETDLSVNHDSYLYGFAPK
ncbi:MAG: hypothetical protein WCP20_12735 [Desulfuromonadales bacterium]